MDQARKTIAYLAHDIHPSATGATATSERLWRGVSAEARAADHNLVAIVGGQFDSSIEGQLYRWIQPDWFDGYLVWLLSESPTANQFFAPFRSRSVLSLSIPIAGFPLVAVDNASGVKSLVNHLIEDHHAKRIAYISATLSHPYAGQRLEAFKHELTAAGLALDERLIAPPLPPRANGARAIAVLLDERGLRPGRDFDSLICSNDRLAVDVLAEFGRRGVSVPDQVRLAGFNNLSEAQNSLPSITTVDIPLFDQARLAVSNLSLLMAGQSIEPVALFPSYLVVHESCGCRQAASPGSLVEMLAHFHAIDPEIGDDWLVTLLSTWEAHLGRLDRAGFLNQLRGLMMSPGYPRRPDLWILALEWLIVGAGSQPHRTDAAWLRGTLDQARTVVVDLSIRLANRDLDQEMHADALLRDLEARLATAGDFTTFVEILADQMKQVGLRSFHLVLSGQEEAHRRLVLALDQTGSVDLDKYGLVVPIDRLLPVGFPRTTERYELVVYPLVYGDANYGYVAAELADLSPAKFSLIVHRIATGLKALSFIDELRQTHSALVEAEKLSALGEVLAGVAHEMHTPLGIGVTAASYLVQCGTDMQKAMAGEKVDRRELTSLSTEMVESSQIILNNLSRAAKIVQNFKQIAVDQASEQRRVFNVADYLNDIVTSLRPVLKQGAHNLLIDRPADLSIDSVPGTMAQIITNLVTNSVVHGFDQKTEGTIRVAVERHGDQLRLVYADDGRGMSAETLAKVFQPFFTTRRTSGGSGLGLTIIHSLVTKQLGGTISVTSQVGKGVQFIIMLPIGMANLSI